MQLVPPVQHCGERHGNHTGSVSAKMVGIATHYALKGFIVCAACDRRMQGNWNHGELITDAASRTSTRSETTLNTR